MEGIEISFPLAVCRDILEESEEQLWHFYQASISPGKKPGKKTLGTLRTRVVSGEAEEPFVDFILTFPRNTIKCPAVKGNLRCRAEILKTSLDLELYRLSAEERLNHPDAATNDAVKLKGIRDESDRNSARNFFKPKTHSSGKKQRQEQTSFDDENVTLPVTHETFDTLSRPSRRREKPSKYRDYVATAETSKLSGFPRETEEEEEEDKTAQIAKSGDESQVDLSADVSDSEIAPAETTKRSKDQTALMSRLFSSGRDGTSGSRMPRVKLQSPKRVVRKYDKLISNLKQASAKSGLEMLSVISGLKSDVDAFADGSGTETEDESYLTTRTPSQSPSPRAGTTPTSGGRVPVKVKTQKKGSPYLTSFPRKFPKSLTCTAVVGVSPSRTPLVSPQRKRSASTATVGKILSKYKKIQPAEKSGADEEPRGPATVEKEECTLLQKEDGGAESVLESDAMAKSRHGKSVSQTKQSTPGPGPPGARAVSSMLSPGSPMLSPGSSMLSPGSPMLSPILLPVGTPTLPSPSNSGGIFLVPLPVPSSSAHAAKMTTVADGIRTHVHDVVKTQQGSVNQHRIHTVDLSSNRRPRLALTAMVDHDYTHMTWGRKPAYSTKVLKTLVKPISLTRHISARVERVEEGRGSSLVTISGLNSKAAREDVPLAMSLTVNSEGLPIADSLDDVMTDTIRRREKHMESVLQATAAPSSPQVRLDPEDIQVSSEVVLTSRRHAHHAPRIAGGNRGRPRKFSLVKKEWPGGSPSGSLGSPSSGWETGGVVDGDMEQDGERSRKTIILQMTQAGWTEVEHRRARGYAGGGGGGGEDEGDVHQQSYAQQQEMLLRQQRLKQDLSLSNHERDQHQTLHYPETYAQQEVLNEGNQGTSYLRTGNPNPHSDGDGAALLIQHQPRTVMNQTHQEMVNQGLFGARLQSGEVLTVDATPGSRMGPAPSSAGGEVKVENEEDEKDRQRPLVSKVCRYCLRLFPAAVILYRHVKTVHSEFTGSGEHEGYLERLRADSRTVCPYCVQPSPLSNLYKLRAHLATFHSHQLTHDLAEGSAGTTVSPHCEVCQLHFHSLGQLRAHATLVHNCAVSPCPQCPLVVVRRASLLAHLRDAHSPHPSRALVCKTCDAAFHTKQLLSAHKQTVHGQQPKMSREGSAGQSAEGRSGVCAVGTSGSSRLKDAAAKEGAARSSIGGQGQGQGRVKCPCCEARFPDVWQLQRHRSASHTGAIPVHCAFCGDGFQSLTPMYNHMGYHLRASSSSSSSSSSGGVHLHIASPSSSSSSSSSSFPSSAGLICPFCQPPVAFVKAAGLVSHVVAGHRDLFPWVCSVCRQRFVSEETLRTHLLQAHDVTVEAVATTTTTTPVGGDVTAGEGSGVIVQHSHDGSLGDLTSTPVPVSSSAGEEETNRGEEDNDDDEEEDDEEDDMGDLFSSLPLEAQQSIEMITQQGKTAMLTIDDGKGGVQKVSFRKSPAETASLFFSSSPPPPVSSTDALHQCLGTSDSSDISSMKSGTDAQTSQFFSSPPSVSLTDALRHQLGSDSSAMALGKSQTDTSSREVKPDREHILRMLSTNAVPSLNSEDGVVHETSFVSTVNLGCDDDMSAPTNNLEYSVPSANNARQQTSNADSEESSGTGTVPAGGASGIRLEYDEMASAGEVHDITSLECSETGVEREEEGEAGVVELEVEEGCVVIEETQYSVDDLVCAHNFAEEETQQQQQLLSRQPGLERDLNLLPPGGNPRSGQPSLERDLNPPPLGGHERVVVTNAAAAAATQTEGNSSSSNEMGVVSGESFDDGTAAILRNYHQVVVETERNYHYVAMETEVVRADHSAEVVRKASADVGAVDAEMHEEESPPATAAATDDSVTAFTAHYQDFTP